MATIHIRGDKEVHNFLLGLPKKIERSIDRGNLVFMKKVQDSAKKRAPRHTGELAESIRLDISKAKGKKKELMVVVDSPYGVYQELGFTPHFINAGWDTKNSLGTVGNAFGWSFEVARVSKSTPFLIPAFDSKIYDFDNIMVRELDKEIK